MPLKYQAGNGRSQRRGLDCRYTFGSFVIEEVTEAAEAVETDRGESYSEGKRGALTMNRWMEEGGPRKEAEK